MFWHGWGPYSGKAVRLPAVSGPVTAVTDAGRHLRYKIYSCQALAGRQNLRAPFLVSQRRCERNDCADREKSKIWIQASV